MSIMGGQMTMIGGSGIHDREVRCHYRGAPPAVSNERFSNKTYVHPAPKGDDKGSILNAHRSSQLVPLTISRTRTPPNANITKYPKLSPSRLSPCHSGRNDLGLTNPSARPTPYTNGLAM